MKTTMKIVIFSFLFLIIGIIGCSENDNPLMNSSNSTLESPEADDLFTGDIPNDISGVSERISMRKNFLYVSFGGSEYSAGAVFYKDNQGNLHSDVPSVAERMRVVESTSDSIKVKFEYLGHHVTLSAFLMPVRYQQVPVRDSLHAFNGLGIVKERQLAYVYSEQKNKIFIFDYQQHLQEKLSAIRTDNTVHISDGREIKPNEIVPDPWESNIHRFWERMTNLESYLPDFTTF